jgi:hypothetical protein
MEIDNSDKFKLIKRDLRTLRTNLFDENEINNWRKIIIIYSLYLLHLQMYLSYCIIQYCNNNRNNNDFKMVFLFFFLICNIRTSYMYSIVNVYKINQPLANNLHSNLKEYFLF